MRQLFFHEESIHEVSRRYLDAPYTHTHTDTPKPICPQLFQRWGHNKTPGSYKSSGSIRHKLLFGIETKKSESDN